MIGIREPTEIEISTLYQRLDGFYPREVVRRYYDSFEEDEVGPFLREHVPWTLWLNDPNGPRRGKPRKRGHGVTLATFERWCRDVKAADPRLYQRVLDEKTSSISRARRILRDRKAAERREARALREARYAEGTG